jgi:hypothetical protein
MKRALMLGAVAIALALSSCSDDEDTTTSPAPRDEAGASTETAPPSAAGQFPPEFVECMGDQGIDLEKPSDIHSSPEAFQACLEFLHP